VFGSTNLDFYLNEKVKTMLTPSSIASLKQRVSMIDIASANSSTSGGGARTLGTSLSAQQIAEMREKVLKHSTQPSKQLQQPQISKQNDLYATRPHLSWDFYPNPQKFEIVRKIRSDSG
jgi:hypothetical protein